MCPVAMGSWGHFYGTVKIWNVSTLKKSLAPDWWVITMEDMCLFRPRAGRVGRKEGTSRGVGPVQSLVLAVAGILGPG